MIIPKKHTDTIRDLTAPEAIEYVDLLGSYDAQGYCIWARSQRSRLKSVVHQHTHLIKTDDKVKNFIFHLKKPYLLLSK